LKERNGFANIALHTERQDKKNNMLSKSHYML